VKRYLIRESMNAIAEPPRKTWFWELESAVIETDRCVQCGTCVAVCPSNSIGINELSNLPELVKMCTGCSLCWDFCPRGGLRYEGTWPPATPEPDAVLAAADVAVRPDPEDPYFSLTGTSPDAGLGRVLAAYAVRAARTVESGQDGGAITALLKGLLSAGAIDGALVAAPLNDPDQPLRTTATIATTPAELDRAAGSAYHQTMALDALDLTRFKLPKNPRIAVVATPCSIEGLRAMQLRSWPTGKHRVDAVTLTIGLLCTKSFDYDGLVTQALGVERNVDLARVSKVDVTRGRLVVTYRDGAEAINEPVRTFHHAALKGCDECADFLGRGADLAVGSVGSADGWSTIIVRTPKGVEAIDKARAALDLRAIDDPSALTRLDELDRQVAHEALARPLDVNAGLFIDYEEHAKRYGDTDRAPVDLRR
jgi:coenzyme F420 hydrogenase subunit beta